MFCQSCNSQVSDSYTYCPNCGAKLDKRPDPFDPPRRTVAVEKTEQTPPPVKTQNKDNPIAIIGLVFAFINPIIGLVCSIIGYSNAKAGGDYRGLAIAGIAVSAASIALTVLTCILLFSFFLFVLPFLPAV